MKKHIEKTEFINSSSKSCINKYTTHIEQILEEINSYATLGISSGIDNLDLKITGIKNDELVFIGSRPTMGKSSMAIGIIKEAITNNKNKIPVMFSLENQSHEMIARLIAQLTEADFNTIISAENYAEHKQTIDEAKEFLLNSDFYIEDFVHQDNNQVDPSKITIHNIRMKLEEIRLDIKRKYDNDEKKIGFIIIDHIELLYPIYKFSKYKKEKIMHEFAKEVKNIIRDYNCPVILLSQFNSEVDNRIDKRPRFELLNDYHTILDDSNLVLFLYNSNYYLNHNKTHLIDTEIIVAKQKNGKTGTVCNYFDKRFLKFVNENQSLDKD